jgi:hypothetical protein
MKNKTPPLFRSFIITIIFIAVIFALVHSPAGAASHPSETLNLHAQNESAGLPTNQLIVKYKMDAD